MDPPKALLEGISVQASSGSDYTFGSGADRLADNGSCALSEASRQRQPPPLPVDGHDPQRKHVANAYGPFRVRDRLGGELANVDQSLYTVRDACERPVRHHTRDRRGDGLTGLKLVDVLLPRVRPQTLDRQRDALPVAIDADDLDPYGVPEPMERGGLDARVPGDLRTMDQAVGNSNIDEQSIRRHADDSSTQDIALGQLRGAARLAITP